jgi:hypothetical protein
MRTSVLIAALVSLVLCFSAVAEAATCFCKIIGKMDSLPDYQVCSDNSSTCTQFGNILPPGCKGYCQGVFASTKSTCALNYPHACQNIQLRAFAACGTGSYKQVDSDVVNVGGTFVCPSGQWLGGVECVTGTPCGFLPNASNQTLNLINNSSYPRYFVWQNFLYQITGPATCQH